MTTQDGLPPHTVRCLLCGEEWAAPGRGGQFSEHALQQSIRRHETVCQGMYSVDGDDDAPA